MVADTPNVKFVIFMPIYTRIGDDGTTSLFGGRRVVKSNFIINALGSIDELSSFIGMTAFKMKKTDRRKTVLFSIQKDLYQIMAHVAGNNKIKINYEKKVKVFERTIDQTSIGLRPLTGFIVPGGNEVSCWFHILRTVCRRCERNIISSQPTIKYFNRLSDLFFVLARFYGRSTEIVLKK